jgi:phosphoadenosine phosphosulfate reductase
VTGLRADQSGERSHVEMASWDAERQLIKLNPLIDWTRDRVAEFCAAEAVPINPLHAEGFLSIGCEPCTRAVAPGENERAGRWWWESDEAKECGLHVDADGKLVRSKVAA